MKSVICGLLGLLFFVGAALPAQAAAPQARQALPVAALYSRSGSIVGWLPEGKNIEVLGSTGNLLEVEAEGMRAYVSADLVEQTADGYRITGRTEEAISLTEDQEAMRAQVIALAQDQLGTPYRWGGKTPGGFDCSGLCYYVYGQLGYALGPHATAQLANGIAVTLEELQPGDLVFFHGTSFENCLASHVGIYIGDGQFIHASNGGVVVGDLTTGYYAEHYLCARRVILGEPAVPTEPQPKTIVPGLSVAELV